jgi:uncharacterized lipoprotein YddW (UPF0748 family)
MTWGVAFSAETTAQEMRGLWVTRWSYRSAQDVERIMKESAGAGFNTVFFQVRGQHDAFYRSSIEPWAKELTGTLGQDPGWDPLAVAVEQAHANGLKLHAYLNAFPFWRGEQPPEQTVPLHAWLEHPEWLVADEEGMPMALQEIYTYASPGNREVRNRLVVVAQDIARRYQVDGIHLDYIRYPGDTYGYDLESLAAWEKAGNPDWDDWRRDQVSAAVKGVSQGVQVPVTVAVWGVYTNRWGWKEVAEGRNEYFQDGAGFLKTRIADAIIPMVYWQVAEKPGSRLDFRSLAADHVSRAAGRHVYIGVRAKPEWGLRAVLDCIEVARAEGAHGVVLFDYSEARPYFDALRSGPFSIPAPPPEMTWR